MRESTYQAHVITTVKGLLPGCVVLKNDANYMQGIPDLLILHEDWWGMLEVKVSLREPFQPNQEYYLHEFGRMSFAACICPENEEEVLDAIQSAFSARRQTRNIRSKQRQLG